MIHHYKKLKKNIFPYMAKILNNKDNAYYIFLLTTFLIYFKLFNIERLMLAIYKAIFE